VANAQAVQTNNHSIAESTTSSPNEANSTLSLIKYWQNHTIENIKGTIKIKQGYSRTDTNATK